MKRQELIMAIEKPRAERDRNRVGIGTGFRKFQRDLDDYTDKGYLIATDSLRIIPTDDGLVYAAIVEKERND